MNDFLEIKSKYPDADIRIVGHSLGGAVGTLFALELIKNNIIPTFLITYGSPRVGNYQFR